MRGVSAAQHKLAHGRELAEKLEEVVEAALKVHFVLVQRSVTDLEEDVAGAKAQTDLLRAEYQRQVDGLAQEVGKQKDDIKDVQITLSGLCELLVTMRDAHKSVASSIDFFLGSKAVARGPPF